MWICFSTIALHWTWRLLINSASEEACGMPGTAGFTASMTQWCTQSTQGASALVYFSPMYNAYMYIMQPIPQGSSRSRYGKAIKQPTIFMPLSTAWTCDALETAFWPSVVPPPVIKAGVRGDETGAASDASASSFLEVDIHWKKNQRYIIVSA